MTALYIVLGIVLVLFLLSLLRIGIRAEWGETTTVTVVAGFARIQVLPKKDKPKKPQKKKKTPSEQTEKQAEKKPEKKLSLTAREVKTLLPAVWQSLKDGLRKTRQRVRIDPLELSAVLAGADDPAGAAELYGYINAGMWTVMPVLEELTRIPDPRLHTEIDFDAEKRKLTGRVGVTMQIRDLFAVGAAFAKPLLRWYFTVRKRRTAEEKVRAAQEKTALKKEDNAPSDGAEHTTTSTATKES